MISSHTSAQCLSCFVGHFPHPHRVVTHLTGVRGQDEIDLLMLKAVAGDFDLVDSHFQSLLLVQDQSW